MTSNKKIYLDYAASTPVDKEVLEAMQPYFSDKYGNPGSLHSFGQEAQVAIDSAREVVASAIGASSVGGFREIIFTGSATEANNLVIHGVVRSFWWNFFKNGGDKTKDAIPHLITTAIEHDSILETLRDIEERGAARVTVLPVNREGLVNLEKLKAALNERTILVSVMYVNNETGVVQSIPEIARIVSDFREELGIRNKELRSGPKFIIHNSLFPLLHTDAVQAFQYLDCDVDKLGADLMTLSAHKICGPKGVGALFIRNNESRIMNQGDKKSIIPNSKFIIHPIVTGGGQEFGLRSGTENVPVIVGFAKAVELAVKAREKEKERVSKLRKQLWEGIKNIYPRAELNSCELPARQSPGAGGSVVGCKFSPHILNIHFPGRSAQDLIIKLDMAGIAVSSGAACSTRSLAPSHVLRAMGYDDKRAKSAIRFSFGRRTTTEEIEEAVRRMEKIFKDDIN